MPDAALSAVWASRLRLCLRCAASQQRAEALSLASPGTAPAAKYATDGLTTEVQARRRWPWWRRFSRRWRWRLSRRRRRLPRRRLSWRRFQGRRAFHGGGFRGGGMAIHRGGFRAAPVFRGGGFRAARVYGGGYRHGYRHAYHRPFFHHRRHFHRRIYVAPAYYGYPSYYGYRHRYCRVVWTHYGPRKICKFRPWWRHRHYGYRPTGESENEKAPGRAPFSRSAGNVA